MIGTDVLTLILILGLTQMEVGTQYKELMLVRVFGVILHWIEMDVLMEMVMASQTSTISLPVTLHNG